MVQASRGWPARVQARSIRGKVTALAGPWRRSGDWWTTGAWARDDWDVALSDGALYRLYHNLENGGWFIEGRYD